MPVPLLTDHRSPNWNARPPGAVVSVIVLHADGDASVDASIAYCCTRASKVSYHTVVGRTGHAYELVDPDHRAWHAGVSSFADCRDVNGISVGVCMGNKQDGREPFSDAQLTTTAAYCADLIRRYPAITLPRIVTHAQVAMPPGRKVDPSPAGPFDLAAFRARVAYELANPTP